MTGIMVESGMFMLIGDFTSNRSRPGFDRSTIQTSSLYWVRLAGRVSRAARLLLPAVAAKTTGFRRAHLKLSCMSLLRVVKQIPHVTSNAPCERHGVTLLSTAKLRLSGGFRTGSGILP